MNNLYSKISDIKIVGSCIKDDIYRLCLVIKNSIGSNVVFDGVIEVPKKHVLDFDKINDLIILEGGAAYDDYIVDAKAEWKMLVANYIRHISNIALLNSDKLK